MYRSRENFSKQPLMPLRDTRKPRKDPGGGFLPASCFLLHASRFFSKQGNLESLLEPAAVTPAPLVFRPLPAGFVLWGVNL